jgi:hypothetical protein
VKELGINQVKSLGHTGNKAFDPLRIVDRGPSVAKKSSDAVNVSSPKSRRSLVARAALRLDNMPNGDRKFGSLVSRKPFGEQSSLDEWRQTGSRFARDVRARASMGDPGESALQEQLFREKFINVLEDRGFIEKDGEQDLIFIVFGGEAEQFLSINSDSRMCDVPEEWRKAFLIARGQALEEGRIAGVKIEQNPAENDSHDITLFREASSEVHQVPKERWPSIIGDMFKKYPDQWVMASTVVGNRDYESLFACMEVYQELEKLQGNKSAYKLEKGQLEQKERELRELRNFQRQQKLKHDLFLRDLQKLQVIQFVIVLQRDLSLQKNIDRIKNLREIQNEISNVAIRKGEIMAKEHESLLDQKKEEVEQARNMQEVYDMMMGIPKFRSIVGKLPKEYIVDSTTIQKRLITDPRIEVLNNEGHTFDISPGSLLRGQHYEVCLFIKRARNIDK